MDRTNMTFVLNVWYTRKSSAGNGACVEYGKFYVNQEWKVRLRDSKQASLLGDDAPSAIISLDDWIEFWDDIETGELDNVKDHYYRLNLEDGDVFESIGSENYVLWHFKLQSVVLVFTPTEVEMFIKTEPLDL